MKTNLSSAEVRAGRPGLAALRIACSAGRILAGLVLAVLPFAAPGCGQSSGGAAGESATSAAADAQVRPVAAARQEAPATWVDAARMPSVPAWAADAVFYQIFPERFRNGDAANDPTRESLESPEGTPASWAISPWTGDWYDRSEWERELGEKFYEDGVFQRRYGGDLQGVLEKLDYLEQLGVNTIYFNPVFYGRSLHKYDAASMHHIDPYFGPDPAGDLALIASETSDPSSWHWTAADKLFLRLVAELHARGMRVIIDGVFNHTGRDFFAFAHLREHQQDSPYKDWYIVQHFDDPNTPEQEFRYKGWWGVETLPEFADAAQGHDLHPGPKAYVMDITRRWMDPNGDGDPADGIDGWRLDVANEVPVEFWHAWHQLVRSINPQAYTVAEIWDDAREFLVGGGFSATMNYHAFAFPAKGFLIDGRMSAHDFGRELELRRGAYPPAMQFVLQNLVDSHDTDRVASMIVNRPTDRPYLQADRFDYDMSERSSPRHDDQYAVRKPTAQERQLQRMVVLLQMAYVGAPMVYYGDEAGMWGGDDPCDRAPMVWQDLQYEPQSGDPRNRERPTPDPVEFDRELFAFYRDAIALRRSSAVLRHGSWSQVASSDEAQFHAFERRLGDEAIVAAFNRGGAEYRWTLPENADPRLEVVLSTESGDRSAAVASRDGKLEIVIPAYTAVVLGRP
ncbi:MAG TPA: alpha-amylase family glycosyl hydrolase [Lacipirellulaceae bacterium]|nr:alpha-amylase family glycosyl hydrolase [Lacipirellulaceae bacterium]